ncbi:Guanine nucleotide-binding protein [Trichinella spiralis]|uniref:Guanine nucleotide-binding protein n=1 Tax=Trichinella spiralis TaxID=6334 RepID=A0ABR3KFC3_TRISP
MLSPAFEDDFKGHPRYSRALRDRSTAGMYAGSTEENNRRHTGGRRLSRRQWRIKFHLSQIVDLRSVRSVYKPVKSEFQRIQSRESNRAER